MLNVSEAIRQDYLTDSVKKDVVIPFIDQYTNVSGVNWYIGSVAYAIAGHLDNAGDLVLFCNYDGNNWDTHLDDYVYSTYLNKAKYIYVSCKLTINSYTELPTNMYLACHYYDKDNHGYGGYTYAFNPNNYIAKLTTQDGLRIYTRINTESFGRFNELALYCQSGGIDCTYGIGDIQIESSDELYSASDFYNNAGTTPLPYLGESIIRQGLDPLDYITIGKDPINDITNDDIQFESFRLQENLCSSDNLKFGACEASYVNFTVFDRNENFKDREIAPYITTGKEPTVEDISWINWYNNAHPAPGSIMDISDTNKAANWWYTSVSGISTTNMEYINKYQWVAVSFKVKIEDLTIVSGSAPYMLNFEISFNAYSSVDHLTKNRSWRMPVSMFPDNTTQIPVADLSDYVDCTFYIPLIGADYSNNFRINYFNYITYTFMDVNGNKYDASYGTYNLEIKYKDIQINIVSDILDELPPYNPNNCLEYYGGDPGKYFLINIPLGVYTISEIKKTITHNLPKTEVTAYDKLTLLEQNAMNWYTRYMYAYSTDTYQPANDFECARQIYSSYFNIAKALGIEDRTKYTETEVGTYVLVPGPGSYPYITNKYSVWQSVPIPPSSPSNACKIHYSKITISNPNPAHPYVVDATLSGNISTSFQAAEYAAQVDDLLRGVTTANIIIEETRNNITYPSDTFVVDSGDYFMLAPDCTSFDIYVPTCEWLPILGFDNGLIVRSIKVSEVNKEIDLTNAHIRLMYYGWHSKIIFPCDSSITGRDVVRSLLEPTGCLYRIDRYGMPDFVYPSKAGLYPSNTLYPANDLYPRDAGDTYSKSKYISFRYEDYIVQNFGRVQIIKKTNSNDSTSICEWEYEGDPDAINSYLIDDNIFYSNADMEYEYGSMAQVSELLENMYLRISNMSYTPHLTHALGLPWMEVGDRVGLLTENGGIESFIYRRTLKGIQLLSDTYEATGNEYIEAVKDYGYKIWEA